MAMEHLYEEMVMAGFGGQGIVLAGKLLAQTAMRAGLEVTFMPSYGAEVRGGTANCMVIVSNKPIACPVVGRPNSLVICNKASLSKFAPRLRPGGLLIFNKSLIQNLHSVPEGVEVIGVPAEEIAIEAGSPKSANMVMLGAYLGKRGHLSPQQAAEALPDVLAERHYKMIPVNAQALCRGAEFTVCYA
jgi:2-oxoglutarate ferredoxin oxidoreductase subunit gamma